MHKYLILIIVSVSVMGCGTYNYAVQYSSGRIEPGFTQNQVVGQLGAPIDSQKKERYEAWRYCNTAFIVPFMLRPGDDDFMTVIFRDEIVLWTEVYEDYVDGDCASHLRPVDWSLFGVE